MPRLKDRIPSPVRDIHGPPTHVLALDLGTGGPKAAILSASGSIVAHAFESVPMILLPGGGAEQDPELWWQAIVRVSRRALDDSGIQAGTVGGIGATAQWSGTVAVDGDGRAIGNAISWMDSRGAGLVRHRVRGLVNVMGYDVRTLQRWIRLTGGIPSQSGKDPVGHILHLKERGGDEMESVECFLEPIDYLNLRLAGVARASFDSITLHWVTDNRHIDRIRYDPRLIAAAGLDPATLPELVPTGSVIGGLTHLAASEFGLVPGTPVVTGTGDLHSAAVGSGAIDDFAGHLYIGTSSWISGHVPFKKVAPMTNITSIPAGLPGKYLIADEHETGGACLTWLRDNVLFHEDDVATARAPEDIFERLGRVASEVDPGSGGVLFTPWLNGERSPVDDHTIRGGWHNLSLSSTRSEMVRAVFEGVAFNSKWLLGAVEKFIGRRFDSLAFIGGGAKSDLWAQIHADVLGRTIRQVEDPVLANVRGAGILTLLALDGCRREDVTSMVAVHAEYEPDMKHAADCGGAYAAFVELYAQTKKIHRTLNHGLTKG